MGNKKIGNDFEREFALLLQDKGFFVYNLPNKYAGQPFDVIAVRHNTFYAFECKHCKGDIFSLSRVEDNQMQSLEKMKEANTNNYYFVFKFDNDIKFCSANYVKEKLPKSKKIHKSELLDFTVLEELLLI